MMASAVLLVKSVYVEAMQSAKLKNNSVNYRKIQADPSIVLIYNPVALYTVYGGEVAARIAEAAVRPEVAQSPVRALAEQAIGSTP